MSKCCWLEDFLGQGPCLGKAELSPAIPSANPPRKKQFYNVFDVASLVEDITLAKTAAAEHGF